MLVFEAADPTATPAATPVTLPGGVSVPGDGAWLRFSAISGWDVLFAVLALVGAWLLSGLAQRATLRLLGRVEGPSSNARVLAARVVKYSVVLLGVAVALGLLGAPIEPIIALVAIVAVVLVLALRGIGSNFAAGVLIQTRQTVRVGETIRAEGHTGVVEEVNGRAVLLRTADGQVVHIPNTLLLEDAFASESALGHRRSEIRVRASGAGLEPAAVRSAVVEAVRAAPGVLADRDVVALVTERGPDTVLLRVQFWHGPADAPEVRSAVVTGVADALELAGLAAVVSSEPDAPAARPGEPGTT